MLEQRLEMLELRLTDGIAPKELPNKSSLTETLLNVNSKVQAAVAAREKLSVLKKTEELEKYLDAEFQERVDLTEGAKLQLILAEEEKIRQLIATFQKMEDLKPVLDSGHIRDVSSHANKVSSLAAIQFEQQEEVNDQTEKVHHLLSTYNQLVHTISKQFLLWDAMLTRRLEQQKSKD